MHPLFSQASGITHDVIGAAIEVHKDKGPGLLESVYEWCLTMELGIEDIKSKASPTWSFDTNSSKGPWEILSKVVDDNVS